MHNGKHIHTYCTTRYTYVYVVIPRTCVRGHETFCNEFMYLLDLVSLVSKVTDDILLLEQLY